MILTILIKVRCAVGEVPVAYPVSQSVSDVKAAMAFLNDTSRRATHRHKADGYWMSIEDIESLAILAGYSNITILPEVEFKELSPGEQRVADYLAQSLKRREIADKVCLSDETVKCHIRSIYAKLHVHSKSAFILIFQQYKIWHALEVSKRT